jgi:hypothetical protein
MGLEPVKLSPSTKKALDYAGQRAVVRGAPEVSEIDILVGVFWSHQSSSEPHFLLEHVGVLPEEFSELCKKADGGFGTVGPLPRRAATSKTQSEVQSLSRSQTAVEILTTAEDLARKYVPKKLMTIHLRHLFGGILLTENNAYTLLERVLADTFLTLEDVKNAYLEFLVWKTGLQSYKDFLEEKHPPVRFPVSGFASDTAGDKDLIGIGPEVNAMAYLIAAKSLTPPLAIGLFGDWGSGKSFFMRALKRRIHKVTDDARESKQPQKDIDIFKYVAQIEFNAWHYVEGELWACLVEHILRNLQRGTEDSETELQKRKKHWIRELRKARQEEEEIKTLRGQLEAEFEQKKEEITEAEEEVEAKRRELERLTARDVWDVVTIDERDKKQIMSVIDASGVGAVSDSTTDLVAALDQSRDLLRKGNVALAPLRAPGWSRFLWFAAVLVVAFIGPGLKFGLEVLHLEPLKATITGVAGFVTAAAGALATANAWVGKVLSRADEARLALEKKREDSESAFVRRVAQLRTEQADLLVKLEEVKDEGEQKRQEILELERELDGLTPGRVLLDFVSERVGSEDYRKHLGVAALIRRDFDKLSDLIKESNESFLKTDTGTPTSEDEHRINRIVLYIDDLDRCPPDRVVEVLQAVHLLMAFPLFVVIVAVDSRWLSQSLRTHYEKLLLDHGDVATARSVRQATAHDYLEKIFQIPFWVRPLPEKARMRIVHGLVEGSLVRASGETNDGDEEGLTTLVQWDPQEPERQLQREAKTELQPKSLEITEAELKCMESVQGLLGQSPRAVKRFVNVYRLIKASAAGRISDFVSDAPDADYRLVIFLLAVVTGLTSASFRIFNEILESGAKTIEQLVKGLVEGSENPSDGETSEQMCAELIRLSEWLKKPSQVKWRSIKGKSLAAWVRQVARFSYRIELT